MSQKTFSAFTTYGTATITIPRGALRNMVLQPKADPKACVEAVKTLLSTDPQPNIEPKTLFKAVQYNTFKLAIGLFDAADIQDVMDGAFDDLMEDEVREWHLFSAVVETMRQKPLLPGDWESERSYIESIVIEGARCLAPLSDGGSPPADANPMPLDDTKGDVVPTESTVSILQTSPTAINSEPVMPFGTTIGDGLSFDTIQNVDNLTFDDPAIVGLFAGQEWSWLEQVDWLNTPAMNL